MKTRIIAIANQKGGVGKTTTTLALAGELSKRGKKVMIVDIDAQGNSTAASGVESSDMMIDVLKGAEKITNAIVKTAHYDLIPASRMFPSVEQELMSSIGREFKLQKALNGIVGYDYIILDTPPQLGLLTVNALTCASNVIVPANAEVFSLQGMVMLFENVTAVQEYANPDLKIDGVLLTKFNDRLILSQNVRQMIENFLLDKPTKLFKTVIRETVAVREAQIEAKPLTDYAAATATIDYRAFADELLMEWGEK